MKNLINRLKRPAESQPVIPRFSRLHLTRTFVETGDERCPIAGIWSRLESDGPAEEAELARPAVLELLLRRVFAAGPVSSTTYLSTVP